MLRSCIIATMRFQWFVVSLQSCFTRYQRLLGALLARILFAAQSIGTIFVATTTIDSPFVYLLWLPLGCLVIEAYIGIFRRKNKEWKWYEQPI